ncbi:MAG: CCA tRNA nucleotidyltransferase [Minisyncoccia bacterium]
MSNKISKFTKQKPNLSLSLPLEVLFCLTELEKNNFQSYLVGGCVRDILLKRKPKDWDIATNANPFEIQKLFPQSIYENQFGTVAVKTNSLDETLKVIEITTFRKEGKYTDKRHPDEIKFSKTIEEDLSRRDFTINAMAMEVKIQNSKGKVIDPFRGQLDLKNKLVRAVGNPQARFQEDALRLIRAIRFACELNFEIEKETLKAIQKNSQLIKFIAPERIKDELIKIIQTSNALKGILLLKETGLLSFIIPELGQSIGVSQNKHHIYDVFTHLVNSLDYAAKKDYSLEVRLASLFHDIGKPKTKRGKGINATFYNHEIVSTKITKKILKRLRFSNELIEKVLKLVRYHGFVYDPEITTDSSVRRLLIKVGKENIKELAQVREADRIGSGCPKAVPFRLRHFLFRVEKILKETSGEQPSLKMLKLNGNDILKILNINPGPKVGMILNILLEDVLDEPQRNNKNWLEKRVKDLGKLSLEKLKQLSEKAKEKYKNLLEEEEKKIKRKYKV